MSKLLLHGQAQNGVNNDFRVQFDLEGLDQGVLHFWSQFGYSSLNGSRAITRTESGLTHIRE